MKKQIEETSNFLITEKSSVKSQNLKHNITKPQVNLNEQLDEIISKYSLIKNRLNKMWNKLD